jgi:hypothetical protein
MSQHSSLRRASASHPRGPGLRSLAPNLALLNDATSRGGDSIAVMLRGVDPVFWRRLLAYSNTYLAELHGMWALLQSLPVGER